MMRRSAKLGLLAATVLCASILPSCLKQVHEVDAVPTAADMAVFAEIMHVTFPPSTVTVRCCYVTGWLDDRLLLKVQIAPADWPAMLASSPLAKQTLSPAEKYHLDIDCDMPWWDIGSISVFQAGKVQLPNASYLKILVDMGSLKTYTVYLHWFET